MNYNFSISKKTLLPVFKFMEKIIAPTVILFITISGCSLSDTNDSESEIEEVPFEILREFPVGPTTSGVPSPVVICAFILSNIDMPGQVGVPENLSRFELVITNQEDLEHYLTCDEDAVEINLDTDFILAGATTTQPHEVFIDNQRVTVTDDTLRYAVDIGKVFTTMPGWAGYIVMIPNAYRDYPVEFIIEWRDEE